MPEAQAIPVAKLVAFNSYFALIYLTMALGQAITAVVSQGVIANPDLMKRILFNPWFAFGLFLLYSALTGVPRRSSFITIKAYSFTPSG